MRDGRMPSNGLALTASGPGPLEGNEENEHIRTGEASVPPGTGLSMVQNGLKRWTPALALESNSGCAPGEHAPFRDSALITAE